MWGTRIKELVERRDELASEIEAEAQTDNAREFRANLTEMFTLEFVAFADAAAQAGQQEREQIGRVAAMAMAAAVVDLCKFTERNGMNHVIGKLNEYNAAIEAEVLREAGVRPN